MAADHRLRRRRKVPDEYVDMLMEESDLWPRRLQRKPVEAKGEAPHVAIIGGGLSGIGLGVYLKKGGIPFVIYEKPGPGGAGTTIAIPAAASIRRLISIRTAFALNPSWTRYFSKQGELMVSSRSCVDRFDLRRHISFLTARSRALSSTRQRIAGTCR